jgi:pyruvate,water dikinase
VGERVSDNYISFAFKGGAADHGRRVLRARFVGDILEEFEFRSEIESDGVTARLEGYDQEMMKEKLKILGYLLIHTRQLDMIMSNDASCLQFKSKMLEDISSVILSKSSSAAVLN